MRKMVWILALLMGCPGKTDDSTSGETGDDSGADDSGDDSGVSCPAGSGMVRGTLLGSDGLPLNSGKATLWDSSGSTELTDDNVDEEGNFQIPYGKGSYQLTGSYGNCVSADIAVTLCGDQTVYQNINLDCAP